jgi:hypothetical protein
MDSCRDFSRVCLLRGPSRLDEPREALARLIWRFRIYEAAAELHLHLSRWSPTKSEKEYGGLRDSPDLDGALNAFGRAQIEGQFLFSRESGVPEALDLLSRCAVACLLVVEEGRRSCEDTRSVRKRAR